MAHSASLTDDQKATVAAAYAERKTCLDRDRAHEETATAQSQDDFDAELNDTAP